MGLIFNGPADSYLVGMICILSNLYSSLQFLGMCLKLPVHWSRFILLFSASPIS